MRRCPVCHEDPFRPENPPYPTTAVLYSPRCKRSNAQQAEHNPPQVKTYSLRCRQCFRHFPRTWLAPAIRAQSPPIAGVGGGVAAKVAALSRYDKIAHIGHTTVSIILSLLFPLSSSFAPFPRTCPPPPCPSQARPHPLCRRGRAAAFPHHDQAHI